MTNKELRCPKCGAIGSLVFQNIQQGAYEHKVLKNGKISKRSKYVHIGPEEWSLLRCTNCNGTWFDTDIKNGFEVKGNQVIFQEIDEHYDIRRMT